MTTFLFGAVAMAFVVVALHFLRFWQKTRDLLFLSFAVSFLIQAGSQLALAASANVSESRPIFYVPRLIAYLLLLGGIASKNLVPKRFGNEGTPRTPEDREP